MNETTGGARRRLTQCEYRATAGAGATSRYPAFCSGLLVSLGGGAPTSRGFGWLPGT
jgi:hypothetical protein